MFKKKKKELTREQKYDLVNKTRTPSELSQVILNICDKEGLIDGDGFKYDGFELSCVVRDVIIGEKPLKLLPITFNIRQQATYLRAIKERYW